MALMFNLEPKLEKRFRAHIKTKFGENVGALKIGAEMAIKEWLDKEGAVEIEAEELEV